MSKKPPHATFPLGRKESAEKWVDNFGLALAARAQTLRFTFRLSSIPPLPLVLHILHITDCPQLSQIWREETISIGDSQRHVSSFPP
jgi:hypothetical protein